MASISFSSHGALTASTGTLKNLFQAGSGYKTEQKILFCVIMEEEGGISSI